MTDALAVFLVITFATACGGASLQRRHPIEAIFFFMPTALFVLHVLGSAQ